MTNDLVNNPSHYQTENGLEAIDVIDAFFVDNHYRATTFKYLARAGKKDGSPELQDLRKARFYLDRDIARFEEAERIKAEAEAEFIALMQESIDRVMSTLLGSTYPQRFLAGLSDPEPGPVEPVKVDDFMELPEYVVFTDKDGDDAVRIGSKHYLWHKGYALEDLLRRIEDDNYFEDYDDEENEADSTYYAPFVYNEDRDAEYQAARQNGAN
ncbi:DUF3310 domain-containing protein [Rhodococcus hoagii]|nr:DUF3310 domain-containing protein [Prescottella equi]